MGRAVAVAIDRCPQLAVDHLHGDDVGTDDLATTDELNADGIARIAGLAALLPDGATSFSGGNIIVGGGGSDILEGRGGFLTFFDVF